MKQNRLLKTDDITVIRRIAAFFKINKIMLFSSTYVIIKNDSKEKSINYF